MENPEAILEDTSKGYGQIAVEGAIRFKSTIAGVTICFLAPLASVGVQTVGWPNSVAMAVGAGPIIVVLLFWTMTVLESTGVANG